MRRPVAGSKARARLAPEVPRATTNGLWIVEALASSVPSQAVVVIVLRGGKSEQAEGDGDESSFSLFEGAAAREREEAKPEEKKRNNALDRKQMPLQNFEKKGKKKSLRNSNSSSPAHLSIRIHI